MSENPEKLEFSKPWQMSDIVLLVEDEMFYVHRKTLALCSSAFEKMFSSGRGLKNNEQITLEGKKAREIYELLQHIYSSDSSMELTERNCYFLLDLAREFRIQKIVRKCESYLLQTLLTMSPRNVSSEAIELLVLAQRFNLKELRKKCIEIAIEEAEDWTTIQDHDLYSEIELENYRAIAEGRIALLTKQLEDVEKRLAEEENKGAVKSLCANCASRSANESAAQTSFLSVACVWASQGMVRVRWCASEKKPIKEP